MFYVTSEPIDITRLREKVLSPKAGAFVCFEGWVRNHNHDKQVTCLEYEVYEPLAMKEAGRILSEAKARFEITHLVAVHRMGCLGISDLAVWIGVSAPHRKAAFLACEYLIDEIKTRLPIWKKETWKDGTSGWVHCTHL